MRRSAEKNDVLLPETWVDAIRPVLEGPCTIFVPLVRAIWLPDLRDHKPQLPPKHRKFFLVEKLAKQAETWLKENLNFSVPAQLDRICYKKILPKVVEEGLKRIKNEEARQILAQILLAEVKNIRHGPDCECYPAIQQLKEFAECHVLCLS